MTTQTPEALNIDSNDASSIQANDEYDGDEEYEFGRLSILQARLHGALIADKRRWIPLKMKRNMSFQCKLSCVVGYIRC